MFWKLNDKGGESRSEIEDVFSGADGKLPGQTKTRWPQENFQALIHIALQCSLARDSLVDSRDLDAAMLRLVLAV